MTRATIKPATLASASYVMANLRERDVEELLCQIPEGLLRHELAYNLLMSPGDSFVAHTDRPVMFFGTSAINAACLSVWALGTQHTWRAVSAVTRFMRDEHLPAMRALGYHSMEARSHIDHVEAHRWMIGTGARQHGPAFEFGTAREKFLLFRWTTVAFDGITGERSAP